MCSASPFIGGARGISQIGISSLSLILLWRRRHDLPIFVDMFRNRASLFLPGENEAWGIVLLLYIGEILPVVPSIFY